MFVEKAIEVNNYLFNYYAVGDPLNYPILFLHGFLGDGLDFQEVMWRLSRQFYCLSIDLPGHGKTQVNGTDEDYQIESVTRGLIEFIDALKLEKSVLVGYSMGGRIALYLAIHFPDSFDRVILESASPGLKTIEERVTRLESDRRLSEELEKQDFYLFLNKWYGQNLFKSILQNPDFPKILDRRLQNSPLELAKSLRNLSTGLQPSLWEHLDSISLPLLLLVGELDPKFVNLNREIANGCPNCKLEIVTNCGHNIHLENADSFIHNLEKFLR